MAYNKKHISHHYTSTYTPTQTHTHIYSLSHALLHTHTPILKTKYLFLLCEMLLRVSSTLFYSSFPLAFIFLNAVCHPLPWFHGWLWPVVWIPSGWGVIGGGGLRWDSGDRAGRTDRSLESPVSLDLPSWGLWSLPVSILQVLYLIPSGQSSQGITQ